MKSNDRIYKIILLLTGVLMASGFAFLTHMRLEQPVFLKHYMTMQVTGDDGLSDRPLSLNYITNANDEHVVIWVEFPDYPGLQIQASENAFEVSARTGEVQSYSEQRGRHFGQYSVREVFLQVRDLPDLAEGEELHLSEAEVVFSDSSTHTVDIGELTLSKEGAAEPPLILAGISSPTDEQTEVIYNAEENLTILSVDTPYIDYISNTIELGINGVDYQEATGQTVQQGEQIRVSATRDQQEAPPDFTVFSTHPQLLVSTDDGEEYAMRLAQAIELKPDYSFANIYNYLKTREGM